MSLLQQVFDESPNTVTLRIVWDAKYHKWFLVLTVFEEHIPQFSITASSFNLPEMLRHVQAARMRVESDFAAGFLQLPDMGDYKIDYHKK
jgi:hypothetical protein